MPILSRKSTNNEKTIQRLNITNLKNIKFAQIKNQTHDIREIWKNICEENPTQQKGNKERQQNRYKKAKTTISIEDKKFPPHQLQKEKKIQNKNTKVPEIT